MQLQKDITSAIDILKKGGLILYPTDTIWGIGCDATNEAAVEKIFTLKHRIASKTMILLVADTSEVNKYVQNFNADIFNYLSKYKNPTTVIYEKGINVAAALLSKDGSIAIRITKDTFCKMLIKQFKKPIVSTSANISGKTAPVNFKDISIEMKNGVDYIVQHRQNDLTPAKPSSIIKFNDAGAIQVIRE